MIGQAECVYTGFYILFIKYSILRCDMRIYIKHGIEAKLKEEGSVTQLLGFKLQTNRYIQILKIHFHLLPRLYINILIAI